MHERMSRNTSIGDQGRISLLKDEAHRHRWESDHRMRMWFWIQAIAAELGAILIALLYMIWRM